MDYENEHGDEFISLSEKVKNSVDKALEENIGREFAYSIVERFSKGENINCQITVVVSRASNVTEEMIRNALGEKLGDLEITNVVIVDTETEKPTAEKEIAFVVTATLKDEVYNNNLGDSSSKEFKTLALKLRELLTGVFEERYKTLFVRVEIIAFRQGSVICEFNVITKENSKVTNADVKETLTQASNKGEIGDYTFTEIQVEKKASTKQQTGDEEKTLPSWLFVAIAVLGVMVLLAIVIIFLACRKRNKRSHNLAFLDVYENYGIAMEEVQVGKSNMNHQEDD